MSSSQLGLMVSLTGTTRYDQQVSQPLPPLDNVSGCCNYLPLVSTPVIINSRWEKTLEEGSWCVHPKDLGFGKLFEMIRDGVIVADTKTQHIVLWNSAATSIFGYSPSEALNGMRVEDLVPERFKAQHRAGMARYHKTGRGIYTDANRLLDLPAIAKNGKEIRVEMSLSPVAPEDESGGPYVLAIVRDITERNRAEEFAAQLLRHLSGEPVSEPDAAFPLEVSLEPRAPLEEAQEVELTTRELEVLRLLALGKTNRQIAQEMLVSLSSVKAYVGRVIDKLGVTDRTQAAVRAVELGLLSEQKQ